jgi:hypothetical protein
MNRDEHRLRPFAQPPLVHAREGHEALWPTDPQGGGTWIAANDSGLVLAVMNLKETRTGVEASRGLVIPRLIGARSIEDLTARWADFDRRPYAAFRLVAAGMGGVRVFEHRPSVATDIANRAAVSTDGWRRGEGLVFSSSSLGDDLVAAPRAALFETLMAAERDPWRAQDRFHQHAWPDRRHLSVLMSSVTACTVSRTEVVVSARGIEMTYRPLIEGWPVLTATRHLPIAAAASEAAA